MVKLGNNNPLLGLAVGDALGSTLEFKKPGTFEPINRKNEDITRIFKSEKDDVYELYNCLKKSELF